MKPAENGCGLCLEPTGKTGAGSAWSPPEKRVRALLGARRKTGAGSTWSPPENGCGLRLEPAGKTILQ